MRSPLPKVLHRLNGRPLITYPMDAALEVGVRKIVVVVGHGEADVRAAVSEHLTRHVGVQGLQVRFERQPVQHGTGHAVACALPSVPEQGQVLILSGDVPLLRSATLHALLETAAASSAGLSLAVFRPPDKSGYGRVVTDERGHPLRIVEERDASPSQKAIDDCNAGVYCVKASALHRLVPGLGRDNAQNEMYLTDLVAAMAAEGQVGSVLIDTIEAAGVNTPEQLASLARTKVRLH